RDRDGRSNHRRHAQCERQAADGKRQPGGGDRKDGSARAPFRWMSDWTERKAQRFVHFIAHDPDLYYSRALYADSALHSRRPAGRPMERGRRTATPSPLAEAVRRRVTIVARPSLRDAFLKSRIDLAREGPDSRAHGRRPPPAAF